MTLKEIVEQYLRQNGFDGLYTDECGCLLDDLFPCSAPAVDCQAGYKTMGCSPECGLGCAFHVGPEKEVTGGS
jgi:hypothetical protein